MALAADRYVRGVLARRRVESFLGHVIQIVKVALKPGENSGVAVKAQPLAAQVQGIAALCAGLEDPEISRGAQIFPVFGDVADKAVAGAVAQIAAA